MNALLWAGACATGLVFVLAVVGWLLLWRNDCLGPGWVDSNGPKDDGGERGEV